MYEVAGFIVALPSDQTILFSIPAAQHDSTRRLPASLSELTKCFSQLNENGRPYTIISLLPKTIPHDGSVYEWERSAHLNLGLLLLQ